MNSFTELGISADLIAALDARGIVAPFPVQAATIPDALAGRDIAARAPTGSGKTLAFGLPLVTRLQRSQPRHPRALILTPTRELAAQICRDLQPLADLKRNRLLAVYGGTDLQKQRRAFNKGVDAVVACPGRLQDLVDRKAVVLEDVDFVVIDEADRMSDMGFLPAVKKLLDLTSPKRQVLLFSATLDGDVKTLVQRYQRDAVEIAVEHEDGRVSHAEHVFHNVERTDRAAHLVRLLDEPGQTIVFCRTRHGADRLTKVLIRNDITAAALHGGHTQSRRERSLANFTRGQTRVLVATDVAARGLHVEGIDQVVHFDPAEDTKTYMHRSGRTARAGAPGNVVSYVTGEDAAQVSQLRRELGMPALAGEAPHAGALALEQPLERAWRQPAPPPLGSAFMSTGTNGLDDKASVARQIARLASERTALFMEAGATAGRSAAAQTRLLAIERELDECFMALRTQRAARDTRRFSNEDVLQRRAIRPRPGRNRDFAE